MVRSGLILASILLFAAIIALVWGIVTPFHPALFFRRAILLGMFLLVVAILAAVATRRG